MRRRGAATAMLTAAALAMAAIAPAGAALAQSRMITSVIDERSTFAPDLSRSDLEVFARVLGLSDDERRAMNDLYAAYTATLAAEGREVRAACADIIARAEAVQDQRLLEPARERMAQWRKRADQLRAVFLDDLRVLLTSEQEARWPILERELRRLRRISAGRLPGERVDLVRVLGDTPGAGEPGGALAEVLERYSNDLDRAIVARDRLLDEHFESFHALISEDPQRALELFERSRRVRTAIRDVNERYTRLIAAELPPEAAEEFRRRTFAAGYPSIAAQTRGERYIRAAAELPSLSTEQADMIRAVIQSYDATRQRLLDRMVQGVWEYESARMPPNLASALNLSVPGSQQGFAALGLGDDHPITLLRVERFELDRATRAKIDAILDPDQRRALPDIAVGDIVFTDWQVWGL